MNRVTLEGRDYRTGAPVRVHVAGETIEQVEALEERGQSLPLVAPGLVDLQLNGFQGIDFNTAPLSPSDVDTLAALLAARGMTQFLPTVITNDGQSITSLVQAIREACEANRFTDSCVPGIHLEGPYISPVDGARGAHDKRYVCPPDWDAFQRIQEASGGRIRILTMSPEWEGAPDFIAKCVKSGVIVSIGHTAATPEQIREAVAAGAGMSTHLGNGAQLQLPRHPNYIWEQLASDELAAGIIADGFHLPESVLKVFIRVKGKQLFLVSDAVYLSGMEPGRYKTHIGGEVVLTEEGRLHVADQPKLLAGSAQLQPFGLEHLVRTGICRPDEAWDLASIRPSGILGLPTAAGVEPGAPADLVLCDWNDSSLHIREVYKRGSLVNA